MQTSAFLKKVIVEGMTMNKYYFQILLTKYEGIRQQPCGKVHGEIRRKLYMSNLHEKSQ